MENASVDQKWLAHLKSQFEVARPVLFTGAGLSASARNIEGHALPTYGELKRAIWDICFPGSPAEEGGSLQDLYAHALLRNQKRLTEVLIKSLTVDSDTIPVWFETLLNLPWQRCYTLNVDDCFQALDRKFQLHRLHVISATSPKFVSDTAPDANRALQCVCLNGTLSDLPNGVTFSTDQYMERLSRPDPWYWKLAGDLLTSPVVFIGTRLDEPPLWQHIVLRRGRGEHDAAEFRHRSYLVTPHLDRARQARLAECNVVWVPMTAQQFVEHILSQLGSAATIGRQYLESQGPRGRRGPVSLKLVEELANNPGQHNEFLMGFEPVWADLQSGRAISRQCDTEIWQKLSNLLHSTGPKGVFVFTGTAGSGKSTSLKRACLRLSADGIRVAWIDRHSELSPGQIKAAMKVENPPHILAVDDSDMYGSELASWIREIALTDAHPLILLGIRSGKVDRALNPNVLQDVPKLEVAMPPLADLDIHALIDLLQEQKRLGILTGRPRDEQERAFREQAGRQLLVAMIQATSGKKFEEKAVQELLDLDEVSRRVYALICVASSFRFDLTRHETVVAAEEFSNSTLNAIANLVRRHIIVEHGGFIGARHHRIAEIITDELARLGQLGPPVRGLARMAAAEASPSVRRSDRYWRMVQRFINHEFLIRTVGREFARNLYESLEDLLHWDFHFWLQRGSVEVEEGDLSRGELYLNTARALDPDDRLVQTEWAYLLLKKASANPPAAESAIWVKEATQTLEALMLRIGDPYPYHILGSQGLAWVRKGLTAPQEKEKFLKRLMTKIEEGCKRYPWEKNLKQLFEDIKREYLELALPVKLHP